MLALFGNFYVQAYFKKGGARGKDAKAKDADKSE